MNRSSITDRFSKPKTWVVVLPKQHADVLLGLYVVAGVEVLVDSDLIWVRGSVSAPIQGVSREDQEQQLDRTLRGLYGAQIFDLYESSQLVPVGKRVPTNVLPSGDWCALTDWIDPKLPSTRMAGSCVKLGVDQAALDESPSESFRASMELSLRRAEAVGVYQEPNLLVCTLEDWLQFATTAGQVRLDPLGFACDSNVGVVVRGNPLPPIPGTQLALSNNVGVPLGWTWFPQISVQTVVEVLSLQDDEIGLLMEDQSWHRISESSFVQANRSSARETMERELRRREGSDGESRS